MKIVKDFPVTRILGFSLSIAEFCDVARKHLAGATEKTSVLFIEDDPFDYSSNNFCADTTHKGLVDMHVSLEDVVMQEQWDFLDYGNWEVQNIRSAKRDNDQIFVAVDLEYIKEEAFFDE